jgi:hypothetical protein
MMGIVNELNSKWQEATLSSRGGHEWRGVALSIPAPVRLFAAVREPDDRLALLLEGPISAAPSSRVHFEAQGLSLTDQRRSEESIFRLAVTLERTELKEVFEALCADLISIISTAESAFVAFARITKRLEAWQACLRSRKGMLSREEQTGLLGELAVLRIVAEVASYSVGVQAWKGPLNGIHDFVSFGEALEVKSVLGIGTYLHISRIDQLEFSGLSSLTIVRVRFREGRDGKNLPSHVETIRREIARESPAVVPEFEDRLLRAGYIDVDAPLYGSVRFVQEDICCYTVDEHFPRLVRAALPTAIVDGSYTIDEKAISHFRQDASYLRQILSMKPGAGNE